MICGTLKLLKITPPDNQATSKVLGPKKFPDKLNGACLGLDKRFFFALPAPPPLTRYLFADSGPPEESVPIAAADSATKELLLAGRTFLCMLVCGGSVGDDEA